MQLAAKLGLPVVNGATKIEAGDGVVTVVRTLEDVVETVEVPLPAVVSRRSRRRSAPHPGHERHSGRRQEADERLRR